MYQFQVRKDIAKSMVLLVFLTLVFLTARLFMYWGFVDDSMMESHASDVLRMWTTGLLYDLRMATILAAPIFVFSLLLSSFQKLHKFKERLFLGYVFVVAFSASVLAISNYYYYQTFHSHFDIFMFGLFEDDTKSVLVNMWDDYPVVMSLFIVTVLASVVAKAVQLVKSKEGGKSPLKPAVFIAYLLVVLTVFVLLGRGSVGTFPLRRADAQVSELSVLNQLTPNAVMALSWAHKDKKQDIKFVEVTREEGQKLISKLNLGSIYASTQANFYLAENSPHVVMNLMESFGSNMLAFDHPSNDLLGELRTHFEQDILFKRFVSHGNGTAPSIAGLFFNSPIQSISHSSAQNIELETPFKIYKQAGYRTVFISPGNMMWRNLVNYLPIQNVDEVYDLNTLQKHYPESAAYMTAWGLPDEYGYRLAEDILKNSNTPVFLAILTVTNHPPYVTPNNYKSHPVSVETGYEAHAEDGLIEQENILTTFQYASNAFGEFLSAIKHSGLAEKTVIAATGDHQMRRIKAFYPQEMMLDRGVPFYLYIPEKIRQNTEVFYDPERVGSHKDIMPTLYNLSLSNTEYLALGGRNMLEKVDDENRQFGYNEHIWINPRGAFDHTHNNYPLYKWENSSLLLVNDGIDADEDKVRAGLYTQLLRWNINRQVKGYKNQK